MLKFKSNGIEYNGNFYEMSKSDMEWVKEENKKDPKSHPARNLKSLASTVYPID